MHGDGPDLIGDQPLLADHADEPSFLAAAPPPAPPAATTPYRVLARKYRPRTFDDLIGQEPMVRTLSNAFESGRIPQAWMLTGVRGVGKTTTARILARALNYAVPGEIDRPSVALTKLGLHCEAIMEGRHVDVIEMDAASHTSINDIREITEASRYKPVSARYKVYIVDEVHMLSTAAFNGLLKTLEEPPEHVKFVFATTEIRKVPVTVLSRCQRFDLRRIDADVLVSHLSRIAGAESVAVEDEALSLIARAAEGSVRDALSLLDQAIAHGGGAVAAADLRAMLGLADRARVIDLFEQLMRGDAAAALGELKAQYDIGADPAVVLGDLAAFVHVVTRLKLVPEAARDASLTEAERQRGSAFAERLSVAVLSRAWQLLLKGVAEVQGAARPLAAAEMVLVRLAYSADLPSPEEAIRYLRDGGEIAARSPGSANSGPANSGPANSGSAAPGSAAPTPPGGGAQASGFGGGGRALKVASETALPRPAAVPVVEPAAGPVLASLADVAELCSAKRDIRLKFAAERQMRLVRMEAGRIEFEPTPDAPPDLAGDLGRRLSEWTGRRWVVSISRGATGKTLYEERTEAAARTIDDARADPLVAAVLARFPGAKVVDVRINSGDEEPAIAALPAVREADDLDGDAADTEASDSDDGFTDHLAFDADFDFDKL